WPRDWSSDVCSSDLGDGLALERVPLLRSLRAARRRERPMRHRVSGTTAAVAERPAKLRCAIYTRKSTEEGLDQDFNSLDAQREEIGRASCRERVRGG